MDLWREEVWDKRVSSAPAWRMGEANGKWNQEARKYSVDLTADQTQDFPFILSVKGNHWRLFSGCDNILFIYFHKAGRVTLGSQKAGIAVVEEREGMLWTKGEVIEVWSWIDLGCLLLVKLTDFPDKPHQEHLFLFITSGPKRNSFVVFVNW